MKRNYVGAWGQARASGNGSSLLGDVHYRIAAAVLPNFLWASGFTVQGVRCRKFMDKGFRSRVSGLG